MDQRTPWRRAWVNGEESDVVGLDDRGLAYGDGLFETMRFHGGAIALLDRHLSRLRESAQRLRIELDSGRLREEISRFLIAATDPEGVLKLIITRGGGGRGYRADHGAEPRRILLQFALPAFPEHWWSDGVVVRYCDMRLGMNASLGGIKHLNRLEQVMARLEWSDPQIAEGLMCDQKGHVVEGVSTNLFLVSGGRLLTPPIEHCGVAGVMRGFILEEAARELSLSTSLVSCERALLAAAQEVFLCNAVIGVWPVRQLEKRSWVVGPVTRRVQAHVARLFAS